MIRRFALLQTFVAVARAGKMKRAANELALTPGAVSQRKLGHGLHRFMLKLGYCTL